MRKPNAAPIGCLDFGAGFFLLVSLGWLFTTDFVEEGIVFGIVCLAVLEWRQGFIQAFLNRRKAAEQAQKMQAQRQRAEQIAQGKAVATTAAVEQGGTTAPAAESTATNEQEWQEDLYFPTYSIAVPQDTEWKPSSAVGLIRGLFERSGQGYIELSIVASHEIIEWQVMFVPSSNQYDLTLDEVTTAVQRHYPNATVRLARIPRFTKPVYRRYKLYAVSQQRYFDEALSVNKIREKTDPLEVVVNALGGLQAGEVLRYDVTILGVVTVDETELNRVLTVSARDAGYEYRRGQRNYGSLEGMVAGELVGGGISIVQNWLLGKKAVMRYSEADTERFMQKLSKPLSVTFISLTFDTSDKSRLAVLNDASGAVLELSGDEIRINEQEGFSAHEIPINSFHDAVTKTPYLYIDGLLPKHDGEVDQTGPYIFNFTAEELAAVWHLPHQGFTQVLIDRPVPKPELLMNVTEPNVRVGKLVSLTESDDIFIRLKDLTKHVFIAGKTGTGKSTLLHNIAHQLVALGVGFTLLDPHGKLIDAILETSIDASARDRILLLELAKDEYPVPLNLFKRVPGVTRGEAVSQVLNTIKSIYRSSWSGTLMEKGYRAFLELLLSDPNATPLDIQEMAKTSNVGYLNRMLKKALAVTDRKEKLSRNSRNFWSEYVEKSESAKNRQTDPILSRLNLFLGKAEMELMTCHPGAIDFQKVVNENMIVLVDLRGQSIASEAESLGAIVFAQVYNAVQALGYQEDSAQPRHFVIVDETHRFMTNEADNAISEARKFGMPIIMADQWIGQLNESTEVAIRNNVGTRLSFKLDGDEAKKTASLLKPSIDPDDIAQYSVGEVALSTEAAGISVNAFKMTTFDKPEPLIDVLSVDEIRQQSLKNLARVVRYGDERFEGRLLTADEVETWLDERYKLPVFNQDMQPDETLVTEVDLKAKSAAKEDSVDE